MIVEPSAEASLQRNIASRERHVPESKQRCGGPTGRSRRVTVLGTVGGVQ
jgi:hypothetical protein